MQTSFFCWQKGERHQLKTKATIIIHDLNANTPHLDFGTPIPEVPQSTGARGIGAYGLDLLSIEAAIA